MIISLIAALSRVLIIVCLVLVIFWHVVQHAGPTRGTAIVHAPQLNVVVSVDDQEYQVKSMDDTPVVCDLESGEHLVVVKRDDQLIAEEKFTIEPERETIVTPRDPRVVAILKRSRHRKSKSDDPDGLAVHTGRRRATHH